MRAPVNFSDKDMEEVMRRAKDADSLLVCSDYDGVLSKLQIDPMSARPLPGGIEALQNLALSEASAAAIISGRDMQSLKYMLRHSDYGDIVLIASHGGEVEEGGVSEHRAYDLRGLARLERIRTEVSRALAKFPGARLESKRFSVAVHTRGLSSAISEAARRMAIEYGEKNPNLRVIPGKEVVELAISVVDKGQAVDWLVSKKGAEMVIFVGDDVTDEDAFKRVNAMGGASFKVGEGKSAAKYRLSGPQEAVALLKNLANARVNAPECG